MQNFDFTRKQDANGITILLGRTIVLVAVIGFSLWRSGFIPRLLHVGFVVNKLALGHVLL
jgi:hypothetical protein